MDKYPHNWDRSGCSSYELVGTYSQEWTKAESKLPLQCLQWVHIQDSCSPETCLEWIYAGGLVKTKPDKTPGPTAGIHTVTVGLRAVPAAQELGSSHSRWRMTRESIPTDEQLRRRDSHWLLSQWACPRPACLAPQVRSTARIRSGASATAAREQTLPLTEQWQLQSKGEPPPSSVSRAGSGHHTSQTPLPRG